MQFLAQPEKERCEKTDMQARHDEHVEGPRFAEGFGLLRIQKAAISQQHRSRNGYLIFLR